MSVTAYPTILVDSATGSDSAASGAGPSTALTGTTAVSTGATIVLDAGTVLTGVATDGSHVLFFNDTTAGNRNFAAINGTSGSGGATPTVTVEQTLATTTKAWAIGGKRAAVSSATTFRLIDNNSSAGDASGGWAVEMQSGHTETWSAQFNIRSNGSTSIGPFILRGKFGAVSIPVITLGDQIIPRGDIVEIRGFKIIDGTGHTLNGINCGACQRLWIDGMVIGDATSYFDIGMTSVGVTGLVKVTNNEVSYCGTVGIRISGSSIIVSGNKVHHNALGIASNGSVEMLGVNITDNVIYSNVSHGLYMIHSPSSNRSANYSRNTLDSNGGDGARIEIDNNDGLSNVLIENNNFTNNSGYGCNWNGSGVTAALMSAFQVMFRNNDFFNNSSGPTNLASGTYTGIASQTANPTYTGGGDYTPTNAALAGTGYPVSIP